MVEPSKKLDEAEASYLVALVEAEYQTAKSNQDLLSADFEATIDMLEGIRAEKNYDWMSDVNIPEFVSIINTEAAMWAAKDFQTRDFVDVYLEGDNPQDFSKAKAAKKLINKTLNRRDLRHYHKHIRTRYINTLASVCYSVCGWEQEIFEEKRTRPVQVPRLEHPPEGHPYWMQPGVGEYDKDLVIPIGLEVQEQEYTVSHIIKDHFEYEPVDPRNVFTDNSYVYSIQDKEFVTIRSERSYEWLKQNAKRMGYMNLDAVKDMQTMGETDTAKETYNLRDQHMVHAKAEATKLDILDRYGKAWALVTKKDEKTGAPLRCTPGRNAGGNIKDGAELIECLITMAVSGSKAEIIRFMPTPFVSTKGIPYRPIARGLCYPHPTRDVGMSDGKYLRELQAALNDTVNMSNDRVKLATMPTFKGNKYSLEDNDQVYMEPEHIIPLNNVDDLVELKVSTDIRGSMEQAGLFSQKMQQAVSIFPTTMGDMPGKASTTATAVAGASGQSNMRANYKDMNFDQTYMADMYWMIMQMTHQFMQAETARLVFGEDIIHFDPDADYTYIPITSAVEAEHSKMQKVRNYDQIIGRLSGMVEAVPAVLPVIAFCIGEQQKLMGSEYQVVAKMIEAIGKAKPIPEAGGNGAQVADQQAPPVSNQNQVQMTGQEQGARGMLS